MLLVPAISIRSAESMINVFAEKNFNPKELLSDLYYSDSGFFFVTLIIQTACLSSAFYVLWGGDLMGNWGSPRIADYWWKIMNETT